MHAQSDQPDDAELVIAAMNGDLRAFDDLVVRYQRQATAVSYRLLNHREDALEVVQDAFLKAYDKLDSLSDPRKFPGWLMRIVSNLSLNRRRRRALRKAASLEQQMQTDEGRAELNRPDPSVATPDQNASAKDVQRMIAEGLAELPEMQRQALILFSMQKMPQKQVAQILGCSVEAVKWHVFTARKKLKDRLKEYL